MQPSRTTGITGELLEAFRRTIAGKLGLAFEGRKLLELDAALETRSSALGCSATQYVDRLANGAGTTEFGELASLLTVGETYFFRQREHFQVCKVELIQEWSSRRALEEPLRILCLGCATGEEPYSLAILAADAFPDLAERVTIAAADLNPEALRRASTGMFSRWSLRETDEATVGRWFTPRAGGFELSKAIRSRIRFTSCNIAADYDPLFAERFDIIFCRNVLMYFTEEQFHLAVSRLARALVPGGHLFLGHAETLRGIESEFSLVHSQGAFYYRRGAATRKPELPRSPLGAEATHQELAGDWVSAIERSAEKVSELSSVQTHEASEPGTLFDPSAALALMEQERFEDALSLLRNGAGARRRDADVLLLEAVLLVHQGKIQEAETACLALLQSQRGLECAHHLLALCGEARGELELAMQHDEAAARLDPTFAMPRLHLGRLMRKTGERKAARAELETAAALLAGEQASRLTLFGGGFSRESLIAVCEAELQALGGMR